MAIDKTEEEKKKREASAREAMMNDLGISRVEEFPMEDRPRRNLQNQSLNMQVHTHRPPGGNTRATRKEREEQKQTEKKAASLSAAWNSAITSGVFDDDDAQQVKGLDKMASGRLHAQKLAQVIVGAALGSMSQSSVVKKKNSSNRERPPTFVPNRHNTPALSGLGILPHGDAPVRIFKPGYATGKEAAKRPARPTKADIKATMPSQVSTPRVPTQTGHLRHAIPQPPVAPARSSARPTTAGKGVMYQPSVIVETAPGSIALEPTEFVFRGDIAIQEDSARGLAVVFICRATPPEVGLFILFHNGRKHKEYSIKAMEQPLAMSSEIYQTFKGENGHLEYAVRMIFRSQAQVEQFVRAFRLLLGEQSKAQSQPAAEIKPSPKTVVSEAASHAAPHPHLPSEHSDAQSQPASDPKPSPKSAVSVTVSEPAPPPPLTNEQPLARHQKIKARLDLMDLMMAGKALKGATPKLRDLSRPKEALSQEKPTLPVAIERLQPDIVSGNEMKLSTPTNVVHLTQDSQQSSVVDRTEESPVASQQPGPLELVDLTPESSEKTPRRASSYTDDLLMLSEPLSETVIPDSGKPVVDEDVVDEPIVDATQETSRDGLEKTDTGADFRACLKGMTKILTTLDESERRAMLTAHLQVDPAAIEQIMSAMQFFEAVVTPSRITTEVEVATSSASRVHHACDSSQAMEDETLAPIQAIYHADSGEDVSSVGNKPSGSSVTDEAEQPDSVQPDGSNATKITYTADQMTALRDRATACPARLSQLGFLPMRKTKVVVKSNNTVKTKEPVKTTGPAKTKELASLPSNWTASRWDSPPDTREMPPDLASQIKKVAESAVWLHAESSDKPKSSQGDETPLKNFGAIQKAVAPKTLRPDAPVFKRTATPISVNGSRPADALAQQNGAAPSMAAAGPVVAEKKVVNLGLGGSRWANNATEVQNKQKFIGHTNDPVGLVFAASSARTSSTETKSSEGTNSSLETTSTMSKLANDFRKLIVSPKPETRDEKDE